jgi:hypothetical protein
MNYNKIEMFDDLNLLSNNKMLNTVYFGGNPVAAFPGYRQKIIEILPEIDQIDSFMVKTVYKVHASK